MSDLKKGTPRRRPGKNTYTTKSGNTIKLNSSLTDRIRARRDARARRKAAYMSRLPRDRWKRLAYRMQPRELARFWFSRDGAIMGLKIFGFLIIVGAIFLVGLFAYFRKDLPNIKDISGDNLGGSITYYDSTGKTVLWEDYHAVKRIPVPGNQQSQYMREATVATEDQHFYTEGAFNLKSIGRAAFDDASGGGSGGGIQGGSTITQQLVKLNENWIGVETLSRKIKEVILATEVEKEFSKYDILTAYLNMAPYGGVEYGVQSAAKDYFNENASQLTLAQSAFLAAMPKAPSLYSPYSEDFEQSPFLARYDYILGQMVKQHMVTQAQATAAQNTNILAQVKPLESRYTGIQAPYFVLAAKQQLDNTYGASTVNRGGWKVITTLNLGLQQDAENDVQNNAAAVAAVGGDEEAMVAESVKTGQVVAEVGGENFNNPQYGQINYANTNISPGSSMKPFLYAALIQNNTDVGAGSVLYDSQQPLPGYPCTNKAEPTTTSAGGNCLWDDNFTYPGPETVRYALAGSRNVPAVKAAYEIDPTDTSTDYTKSVNEWIDMANSAIGTKNAYACYQQGVDIETASTAQQTQCYGSAALGSGDIPIDVEINGDVTLARLGAQIPQTYILNITDAAGHTVYQWHQPKSTQVYKPDTAYIIDSILDDPRATYLQPYQKFQNYNGWDIAVKTGTENQEYNGVMTAWSTQYAVIGFAGYHTLDQPLEEGHFEDITEPITKTWMEQALNGLHTKAVNWVQPSDIKTIAGYVQRVSTGYGAEVPGPTDDLYPSWYIGKNSGTTSETIDKVSGLLATSCTPALAKETEGGADDASFSIDIFYPKQFANEAALEGGGTATSSTQTDNVHSCSDAMPAATVTQTACDDVDKCDFTVTVTQGTHPLAGGSYTATPAGTISLLDNGKVVDTVGIPANSSSPYTATFSGESVNDNDSITAQVVDSVLYSATSPAITVTNASTPTTTTPTPPTTP
jgi:penicillin-binding protein 1A